MGHLVISVIIHKTVASHYCMAHQPSTFLSYWAGLTLQRGVIDSVKLSSFTSRLQTSGGRKYMGTLNKTIAMHLNKYGVLYIGLTHVYEQSKQKCMKIYIDHCLIFASSLYSRLKLDGWPPGKTGRCEPGSVHQCGLKSWPIVYIAAIVLTLT